MARTTRRSAFAGMTAALAMTVTPIAASAAEIPSVSMSRAQPAPISLPGTFDSAAETAEHHRGWRGYRGYRGYRHRHRGIRTGDVLAGVLILGGIAAVASAASKDRRERDYRDRDYRYRDRDVRYRDRDYEPRRGDSRYNGGRGIDNAVRMCVDEIERDVRVDSVDSVDRNGEGWSVTGVLFNGDGFTCRIGSDGRISDVDYGGRSIRANFSDAFQEPETGRERPADGQWSADRYADARRSTDTSRPAARTIDAEALPAYPGGPLPGEELAATDGQAATGEQDDRYRTAEVPDFTS